MLQAIREKTQGIIAAILLGMVGVPFALWGVNSYFSDGTSNIVAEVNGIEINRMLYDQYISNARSRLKNPQLLENKTFRKELVNNIIREQLLIQDARDLGFVVGDRLLQKLLSEQFQTKGRFDRRRYDTYLANIGTTALNFENRIRRVGVIEQMKSSFQDSVFVTKPDREGITRLWTQERIFSYLIVTPGPYTKRLKISDEAIKAYYAAHPDEFKTIEKVQVEYVVLSIKDLAKRFIPSEDEIRAEYNANKSAYTTVGKRRASHILFELLAGADAVEIKKALAKVRQIQQKLRAGASFADLAKRYSEDTFTAKRGGDLNYIKKGVLPKELEATIYKLKPKQISKPVRSKYGYHIVKLTESTPDKVKSYREVRPQLAKQIALQRAEKRFDKLNSEFNNLVYEQPESLRPVSAALNIKLQKSDWFPRIGGKGLMANPKIIAAAYSKDVLQEQRNSEAIDIGSDTVVAIRVAAYQEAKPKPLEQVQEVIRRKLRYQKAREMAVKAGEKILQQVKTGKKMAVLARQKRLKFFENIRTTRTSTEKGRQEIFNIVFKAGKPSGNKPIYGSAEMSTGGYIVYRLSRVAHSDPSKLNAVVKTLLGRELLKRRGTEYYQYYQQSLQQQADITIYDKRL